MKVAINGFGRIGKMLFRAAIDRGLYGRQFDLVAFNFSGTTEAAAHMLKYDSIHGKLQTSIAVDGEHLVVGGKKVRHVNDRNPANLPWGKLGVDAVYECTGAFTDKEGASGHLKAGAKKVVISAPGKGVDATIVLGVNDKKYDKGKHHVISMASCTTGCLAPVAMVLEDTFGIEKGYMVTVHAYTNDQLILDANHKDVRRARAAGVNIVPTSTGAAKAIGDVIPSIAGKLDGIALRVPVVDGSMNDLTVMLKGETTKEEVNAALKKAAGGKLKGYLEYSEEPLVSTDIIGNPHSAIVDSKLTMAKGSMVKVLAWYDNEWGYSCRLAEMVKLL